MSDRAVFLDRDGTIARDVNYCSRVEDFEILSTVPEAIRLLNLNDFRVVVITNQSGIARGYFTEETLGRIHDKMVAELARQGARLDAVYYCPHHPDDHCGCRKPATGMFLKAAGELDIDFSRSYVVGDMQLDIEAGKLIGCKTILVTTGPRPPVTSPHVPDYVAANLMECVKWIIAGPKK
jgi:D,D-heptose 1,7-bisphosphate phosphatase